MRIIRRLTYLGPPAQVLAGWSRRAVQGSRAFGHGSSITEEVLDYDEGADGSEPPPLTDDDLAQMTCVELEE